MADTIQQVYGYHGTSVDAATAILRDGFRMSRNEYDWLGDGVYFFQDAPERAWEWATTHHSSAPAVICALIRLEDGMDLLDIGWNRVLMEAYDSFLAQLKSSNQHAPVQSSGAHRLDQAVINHAVGILETRRLKVRAVRAAFSEGNPVFPGSAIFDRSHVQIAVRDTALIENCWRVERST